jgi:hypothetical protein
MINWLINSKRLKELKNNYAKLKHYETKTNSFILYIDFLYTLYK